LRQAYATGRINQVAISRLPSKVVTTDNDTLPCHHKSGWESMDHFKQGCRKHWWSQCELTNGIHLTNSHSPHHSANTWIQKV